MGMHEVEAYRARTMREIALVQARAKDAQTRDVRISLVWRGLREAIDTAPDAFPRRLLDARAQHALAVAVVDTFVAD